jgi:type IV pilus assembly protein PilM
VFRLPLKQQSITSISPGARNLKMVQSNGKGQIKKAHLCDMPTGVINQMKVESPEMLADTLKQASRAAGISTGECTLCLSGPAVIIRHLVFPYMNDAQLYHNVLSEISGYLPVDSEKFSIDYQVQEIIQSEDSARIKVMVVAIQKEILSSYLTALKLAGYRATTIDIAENAREKLLRYAAQRGAGPDAHYCVIDFGASATSISAYYEGRFFVNKIVTTGGNRLTEIITENRQMDMLAAESYKAEGDFLYGQDDPECHVAITALIDQWIGEATRVIDYFLSRNQTQIQRVYLCGGGAQLKGLARYLEEHMELPVEGFDSFVNPLLSRKAGQIEPSYYADAIGATFREVSKS